MSDEEKRLEGQRLLAVIQAQRQKDHSLLRALDALAKATVEPKPEETK